MESATNLFIRIREFVARWTRGQTLTEYTLVLVAVAIAAIGVYRALGNNIGSLANGANSTLTNA
jgi:Flp pilus assembly pilin Flp